MRKLLPALAALVVMIALALSGSALAQKKDKGKSKKDESAETAKKKKKEEKKGEAPKPKTPAPSASSTRRPIPPPPQKVANTNQSATSLTSDSQVGSPAEGGGSGGTTETPPTTDPIAVEPAENPAPWVPDPIIFGIAALMVLAALGLHALHFMSSKRTKEDFAQISHNLYALQRHIEEISAQILELKLARNQPAIGSGQDNLSPFSDKMAELEGRIRDTRSNLAEASQAIAAMANWAGESAIERATVDSQNELSADERAQAVRMIERHLDVITANAARLQPLTQEMADFEEKIKQRTWLPSELLKRTQSLSKQIMQFEKWKTRAGDRIEALMRGSVSDRRARFAEEKNHLAGSLNMKEISVTDYVKGCRQLSRELFKPSTDELPLAEFEGILSGLSSGAADRLMNWYDDFFQLHSQAIASQSSIDEETARELARIRRTARDTLLRFDIQPEEIQPGQTSFDHRLHEAAVVTQSSQFPANTVIGVQQCGFRRASSGEVLRRPKVVVARVGAG